MSEINEAKRDISNVKLTHSDMGYITGILKDYDDKHGKYGKTRASILIDRINKRYEVK